MCGSRSVRPWRRGSEVAKSRLRGLRPLLQSQARFLKNHGPVNAHICQFENATPANAKTLDSSPKYNDRYATQSHLSYIWIAVYPSFKHTMKAVGM